MVRAIAGCKQYPNGDTAEGRGEIRGKHSLSTHRRPTVSVVLCTLDAYIAEYQPKMLANRNRHLRFRNQAARECRQSGVINRVVRTLKLRGTTTDQKTKETGLIGTALLLKHATVQYVRQYLPSQDSTHPNIIETTPNGLESMCQTSLWKHGNCDFLAACLHLRVGGAVTVPGEHRRVESKGPQQDKLALLRHRPVCTAQASYVYTHFRRQASDVSQMGHRAKTRRPMRPKNEQHAKKKSGHERLLEKQPKNKKLNTCAPSAPQPEGPTRAPRTTGG